MSMLGENIRLLRDKQGMTQVQLGEKIGLAESTISLYESGKREPDIDTIGKLADFFGVSTDYLLGRDKASHRQATGASQATVSAEDLALLEKIKNLPAEHRKIVDTVIEVNQSGKEHSAAAGE